SQRNLQVLLNVISQSFQRGNVENLGSVRQMSGQSFAHQAIDASQECCKSFSRSSGGGDERSPPGENVRPTLFLRLSRSSEPLHEPFRDEGVGPCQRLRKGEHGPCWTRIRRIVS